MSGKREGGRVAVAVEVSRESPLLESEELLARITSSPGDKVGTASPGHNGFLSTLGLFYEFARNGERKHASPPSFLLPSAPHRYIRIPFAREINPI